MAVERLDLAGSTQQATVCRSAVGSLEGSFVSHKRQDDRQVAAELQQQPRK
jgi:hypothetical protein